VYNVVCNAEYASSQQDKTRHDGDRLRWGRADEPDNNGLSKFKNTSNKDEFIHGSSVQGLVLPILAVHHPKRPRDAWYLKCGARDGDAVAQSLAPPTSESTSPKRFMKAV
jgi:hypothetical protein